MPGPYNGTAVGSPTYVAAATGFGQAATLNGSTQYFTVAAPSGPFAHAAGSSWTETIRFQLTTLAAGIVVLKGMESVTGAQSWWVGLSAGKPVMSIGGSTYTSTGAALTASDGVWHTLVLVCTSGTSFTLYLDGTAVAGATAVAYTYPGATGAQFASIGAYNNGASWGFFATAVIDEVASFAVALTGTDLAATAPFANTKTGLLALYHLDGDATDSAVPTTLTIAPNDAAILYAPGVWDIHATYARTVNVGASLRVLFTGTSLTLLHDMALNVAPYPLLWTRLDRGPWQQQTLAASVQVASGLTGRTHLLEALLRSTHVNGGARWLNPARSWTLTGLQVDAGASWSLPLALPRTALWFADSIGEGLFAHGSPNSADANNDVLGSYAGEVGRALGAELGLIAFGGNGITVTDNGDNGGVPVFGTHYALLYSGVARTFPSNLSFIGVWLGENDSLLSATASAVTTALQTALTNMAAANPSTPIIVFAPLPDTSHPTTGGLAAAVQAAVTGTGNSRIIYVDTTGWIVPSTDTVDGIHPYDYAHQSKVLPRVVAAVQSVLGGAAAATARSGYLGRRR